MEYEIYPIDELYHHGIKGMRWGIRRYQKKDGSLTNAGKKHRAALEDKSGSSKSASKSRGVMKAKTLVKKSATEEAPKKKTLAEMTDDEVRQATNRMQLEKQYHEAARGLAAANPKQVSNGKKFLNSVLNDVVAPAAKEAGKKWLTKFMEDELGLNKKSELQRLEEKFKKFDYKKKISDLEKGIGDNDYLSELERDAKKAKAEYEIADYGNKKENIGKDKPEKIDWDAKNKEQTYIQNQQKTAKAQKEYEAWLEEERKKREQGDS